MILSVTFSKPTAQVESVLGKPYTKIRIRLRNNSDVYEAELFTEKQSFQKTMTVSEVEDFVSKNAGTLFKNVTEKTESEEITVLANRHGEIKTLRKKISGPANSADGSANSADGLPDSTPFARTAGVSMKQLSSFGKKKNYIIAEGTPVPFLVRLGVMTKDGKVITSKYDKFRQINRFLEFIRDVLPEFDLTQMTEDRPLRISDFGCGKSYLSFAIYYFLNKIMNIPVEITGIDLKEDVIKNCSALAEELNFSGMHFVCGDVALFKEQKSPDIMITLHACDTATDYALKYAIDSGSKVILSVPCCQHEINLQLEKKSFADENPYASIMRYGLLRERFAALATDALRAEFLEQSGYGVQVLEFIDMEHTPKNILLRAVKKNLSNENAKSANQKTVSDSEKRTTCLLDGLQASQTLHELL